MKYIASVSFGKDSVAMLLTIFDHRLPLDEVVFYDTGMEFDAIYKVRDKMVNEYLLPRGIKYTELKPDVPFEYKMFEKEVNGRNGKHFGYSWCGGRCRWGTTEKLKAIDKYCTGSEQYIGIAFDEQHRVKDKLYPLVILGMTEKDCLALCRKYGFSWEEDGIDLYNVLDRVSCWCCANKNLKELRNYRKYLPKYWQKLKEFQTRTDRPFHNGQSVFDLDKRFEGELL